MASTYENDLRLEEMATGENSGSWGTKTNTNLELIADAFSYGTETIANADTTITIADGAADAARSLALKINSSEDLTTTRVVTLAPNTTSKVWIIENNTSGGQTLTISAGSGSNITLANGKTKIIATDGIGAGSNVVELTQDIAIADLFVDDDLTVGDDIIMDSDGGILKIGADADLQVTHSGSAGTITNATGDLTLDVAGDIILDADDEGKIQLHDNGVSYGRLDNNGGTGFDIVSTISNGDLRIRGNDGGSTIEALTFDMSEAGAATFNVGGVFNESGADSDFRVESDNSTHALFVNAAVSRVGIKTASPDYELQVGDDNTNVDATIAVASAGSSEKRLVFYRASNKDWEIVEDTSENLSINSSGITGKEFVINNASNATDFRVESDGNTHALFVDASANHVSFFGTSNAAMDGVQGVQIGDTSSTSAGLGMATANHSFLLYIDNSNDLLSLYDSTNNVDRMQLLNDGTFVFNQTGEANADFRIEALGSQYAFFVDSGNNVIGAGTSTPATYVSGGGLAIKGSTKSDLSLVASSVASGVNSHQMRYWNEAGASYEIARTRVNVGAGQVNRGEYQFAVNNGAGLRQWLDVNYQGDVVFNDGSHDSDFRVESDNNANMLFLDAEKDLLSVGGAGTNQDFAGSLQVIGNTVESSNAQTAYSAKFMSSFSGLSDTGGFTTMIGLSCEPGHFSKGAIGWTRTASYDQGRIGFFNRGDSNDTNAQKSDEMMRISASEVIVNPLGSATKDFRVESDNNANMLFVNAGENSVGIGTSTDTTLSRMSVGLTGAAVSGDTDGATIGKGAIFRLVDDTNWGTTDATVFLLGGGTGGAVGQISSGIGFSRESNGNWGTQLRFYTHSTSTVAADIDELNEQMRITSGGDVYLGTTSLPVMGSTSAQGVSIGNSGSAEIRILKTSSDPNVWIKKQGATGTAISFYKDTAAVGTIVINSSSVSYNTTSDHRLKENVVDLTGATNRLKQLEPKRFNFISDTDDTTVDGFIAHEVQSVVPEAITGTHNEVDADGNPVYQGIDQSKLVPLLVATIKELEARITALENA